MHNISLTIYTYLICKNWFIQIIVHGRTYPYQLMEGVKQSWPIGGHEQCAKAIEDYGACEMLLNCIIYDCNGLLLMPNYVGNVT